MIAVVITVMVIAVLTAAAIFALGLGRAAAGDEREGRGQENTEDQEQTIAVLHTAAGVAPRTTLVTFVVRSQGPSVLRWRMSLRELAGRVLVAGFEGTDVPPQLRALAAEGALAGTIVFTRNFSPSGGPTKGSLEAFATAKRLLGELASLPTGGAPLLLCIDEEGGRVRRLGPPVPQLPPARVWGERDDVRTTERAGAVLGEALASLGVNVDFAPILDVDTNPGNPIIGDRAFSRDPHKVIEHALAFARGLASAGVLPCGKHFPGHGDTDLDSHLALPSVPHPRERLDRIELAPFAAAKGALPMIMTAHVVFPALDPDMPATHSPKVIEGLLRQELGYDGVIVSDDLEMKAVAAHWGVAKSAVLAIQAGCDLLLVCRELSELKRAHEALIARATESEPFAARLSEAAGRVDALRATLRPFVAPSPETLTSIFHRGATFLAALEPRA